MNVPPFWDKIKGTLSSPAGHDTAIALVVVLVGFVSFFLGRLSVLSDDKTSVLVSLPSEATITSAGPQILPASAYTGAFELSKVKATVEANYGGAFLASKNGTKYYPAGCSAANRIKEGNRVWFKTEADAQAQGLTRSTSCK
jgi:hypothetical protein